MALFVHILCVLTSAACAGLLFRSSRQSPSRLLFWSGWSFIVLAAANLLLFFDFMIGPEVDLILARNAVTLTGIGLLLYGLVWETE